MEETIYREGAVEVWREALEVDVAPGLVEMEEPSESVHGAVNVGGPGSRRRSERGSIFRRVS